MSSGKITYAIQVSFCRYWVWIVGPTLVWGLFPLFYAGLPDSIRGDLSLPAYGMLMVTRALIAAIFFASAAFLKWRTLDANGKKTLKTFFLCEKRNLFLAVVTGLVLCRLFESFIFASGEFAFGLIFCVALTPFAERILSFAYIHFGRKRKEHNSTSDNLWIDLRTVCVEWPTPTTQTHTWLRLVLLALVIVCFLYAKQGFILRNTVDTNAVDVAQVSDEQLIQNWKVSQNPWTGETLAKADQSGVLLVVKPTTQKGQTLLTGYGRLLLFALCSALCLQFYYHLLDVLGVRFGRITDHVLGANNVAAKDRIQLTKVYIQQALIWSVAGLIWSAVWLAEPRNGLALLGDLVRSPTGMLAWIGGVGLLGTVLCYFADNFGIDRYSKWAEIRELPVSASKWAGIATTVDPVISLVLVSICGAALHEHVAVPWMAWAAAFAMALVFAARFQETATEVYQRTIDRALRKRMHPSAGNALLAAPQQLDVEAQQIAEFMALSIDGSSYVDDTIDLVPPIVLRKRICDTTEEPGGHKDVLNIFLENLCRRLQPRKQNRLMATLVRLKPIGKIMHEESERIDKLRLFLLERLQSRFAPLGASVLELDVALDLAGYVSLADREHIHSCMNFVEDGWDLVLLTNPDWSTLRENMNADWIGTIERTARVLLRILQGDARIAAIGESTDLPFSGFAQITEFPSLDSLNAEHTKYDLAFVADCPDRAHNEASQTTSDMLPQILLLRKAPTIAEREQMTLPWVRITDDAWTNRTAVAKAVLGHYRQSIDQYHGTRVLVVEDNQRDFDTISAALKATLGTNTGIVRYQPTSPNINDYQSVLTDILSRMKESPVDSVVFDIELVDEMFANFVEKVSGIDLATDINKVLNDSALIALLSRARVADLSLAEDDGVLIASKTPSGYSRLAGSIASRQPSLFIAGLTAYAYAKNENNAALLRILRSGREPGADGIIADIEKLLQHTLKELTSIRVLALPEFSNANRNQHA
jgi:hypothetical protein